MAPSEWEVVHGAAVKTIGKAPRMGSCPEAPLLDALAQRGYRQGENLEWLQVGPVNLVEWGGDGPGDFLQPAAVLVARQPDVIVTEGEDAARAATSVTTTIPIVVNNVNDLVDSGFVMSAARPGRNITGVSTRTRELSIKRIELLKQAFPHVKRPILIYGTAPSDVAAIEPSVRAARQMGLAPIPVQFATGCGTPTTRESAVPGLLVCTGGEFSDLDRNLYSAIDQGADSIVVSATSPFVGPLASFLKYRRPGAVATLPGVFPSRDYDSVGAISLRQPYETSTQVAIYVDKILRGENPGDLPVIAPTNVEVVINLKAASDLGLTIAPSALAMATTVIR